MENLKTLADKIIEATKEIVEGSGREYEPTKFVDSVDNQNAPSESEKEQFSSKLASQIEEGTKKALEYDEWYKKEYGSKNSHVSCRTVSL
ncbi:MAG: hypothetical protein WAO52_18965 [Prolixibacteraceae bacterium]